MLGKWNVWIYKGNSFFDCVVIDREEEIFRTRISEKNFFSEKDFLKELVNRLNLKDGNDELRSADIHTITKYPGVPNQKDTICSILLTSITPGFSHPWINNSSLFDHVISVDEKKLLIKEKEAFIKEEEINVILRQVFEKPPDLVFIILNEKQLETTLVNLLKTAGFRNVVVSSQ